MNESQPFLQACRAEPAPHVPVWYMRQAGRYQPEYRKIREKYSLLDICENPELCLEVTKLPVTQLGVDAAILFSDIMVPLAPMGMSFEIRENVGPVVEHPIRCSSDVERLRVFDPAEDLAHVLKSISLIRDNIDVPLIGFTGAPFTLASYMIEGKPSRDYVKTKQLMWGNTPLWQLLMDKLADVIIVYLTAQVQAGAAAVQIFDSWVGSLGPEDYRTYVLPTMQRIFRALKDTGVPMIYFGVNTGELLQTFTETGASVIGVDWRVPIDAARQRIGGDFTIQGNIDPAMLFAPWPEIERRTRTILDAGMAHDGFIFNLGHGVIHHNPTVEVETLRKLTAFVHEYSADCLQQRRTPQ